ncbi:hypothetical protein AB0H71_28870 [Nocardia sp. NPDC050697]|uniref:hypothetical protein n=1 Tax=Nocardia sp. NPDC050697 TaxID=3155158 RepID=UPI0033D259ED
MQQGELSSNNGYLALKPEVNEGVPVIPDTFVPLYGENLTSNMNPSTDTAIFGNKAARLTVTPGTRSHPGELTVMAEPNTTEHFFNMLLTGGSKTGSGPYTRPFTASFAKPRSYTVDISSGNQVFRYMGVQASEISPDWSDKRLRWKLKVAALKSFLGAEIASISTATVTLKTPLGYPRPTEGLVVGDLVAIVADAAGARQNLVIQSLTDTTVTFTTTPTGVLANDMLILRPVTNPVLNLLTEFMWGRTEFRIAADAATALNATHTPMEEGTEFTISHPFDDDNGAQSSGSFDPSRLVRGKTVDYTFKAKKFFYNPDEVRNFKAMTKKALVIRLFSDSGYECRITFNEMILVAGAKPLIKDQETEYYELEYIGKYSQADGQMLDVKVINNVA